MAVSITSIPPHRAANYFARFFGFVLVILRFLGASLRASSSVNSPVAIRIKSIAPLIGSAGRYSPLGPLGTDRHTFHTPTSTIIDEEADQFLNCVLIDAVNLIPTLAPMQHEASLGQQE